jgi:hypothetical protein
MAEDAATTQNEPEAPAEPKAKREPRAKAEPKAPAEPKAKREPKAKAEPKAPAEPEAPAKPVDPRLKVLKKFYGKFLPKGVLRDRHKAIMDRWNSGEDHGGVTVEELKALLDDWLGAREKPPRKPQA